MCQPKPIKLINKLGAKNESPLGPLQYNVCKQITLLLHCSPHAFTNFQANQIVLTKKQTATNKQSFQLVKNAGIIFVKTGTEEINK